MRVLGVDVTYALSPQAKGKVERPYHFSTFPNSAICGFVVVPFVVCGCTEQAHLVKEQVQRTFSSYYTLYE